MLLMFIYLPAGGYQYFTMEQVIRISFSSVGRTMSSLDTSYIWNKIK